MKLQMLSNVIYFIGIMFSTHTHTHTKMHGRRKPPCSSRVLFLNHYLFALVSHSSHQLPILSDHLSPKLFFQSFPSPFPAQVPLFQPPLCPCAQLVNTLYSASGSPTCIMLFQNSGLPFFFLSTLSLAVSHTYLGCAQIEK